MGGVDAGKASMLPLKLLIKISPATPKKNGSVLPGTADFFSSKEINYVF
jgi:hypothetical protein